MFRSFPFHLFNAFNLSRSCRSLMTKPEATVGKERWRWGLSSKPSSSWPHQMVGRQPTSLFSGARLSHWVLQGVEAKSWRSPNESETDSRSRLKSDLTLLQLSVFAPTLTLSRRKNYFLSYCVFAETTNVNFSSCWLPPRPYLVRTKTRPSTDGDKLETVQVNVENISKPASSPTALFKRCIRV